MKEKFVIRNKEMVTGLPNEVKCPSFSIRRQYCYSYEDQAVFNSLHAMVLDGIMKPEKAKECEVNYKEKKLKDLGINTTEVKTYGIYGRVYTHIGAKLQKDLDLKTDTITAKNRQELIEKLFKMFFGSQNCTLNECFERYHVWRLKVGTKSKTLKEDRFQWNRFFRDTIGNNPIDKVSVTTVRDLFLIMTANNAITKTCFVSARSVLNGLFRYCVEMDLLRTNPINQINYAQFKKRFKPIESKPDYTREEVTNIVCGLRNSTDVYDCAIRFAFNACMRFGELRSIQYSDINDGIIKIRRSSSDGNAAYLDATGHVAFSSTASEETVIKGAADEGIRDFPLTPEAKEIIEYLHEKYPDNEYIFMSNGGQLKNVTFNRHLKKICDQLNIRYRSSQIIRFTNCDALFNEANVSMQSMQGYMGHSKPSMTDHYIARHKSKDDDNAKVINYLRIDKNGSK